MATELLYFGEDGRLYIQHECEMCELHPLEDLNEPCLECGYSQAELLDLQSKVEKQNEAYDFFKVYTNKKEDNPQVKGALLHVQSIVLGEGVDRITLADLENSGKLRDMAGMTDKLCYAIFYWDKEQEVEVLDFTFFLGDEE